MDSLWRDGNRGPILGCHRLIVVFYIWNIPSLNHVHHGRLGQIKLYCNRCEKLKANTKMCVTYAIWSEGFYHSKESQPGSCFAFDSRGLFLMSRRVSVVKNKFTTVTNPVKPPEAFHMAKAAIQDGRLTCNADIFASLRLVAKRYHCQRKPIGALW